MSYFLYIFSRTKFLQILKTSTFLDQKNIFTKWNYIFMILFLIYSHFLPHQEKHSEVFLTLNESEFALP